MLRLSDLDSDEEGDDEENFTDVLDLGYYGFEEEEDHSNGEYDDDSNNEDLTNGHN